MGYKNLGGYLKNYNVNVPDYMQQFLGSYNQSPYLNDMIGEMRQSSSEDFGRGLGQIGGFFSEGGRYGGGAMRDQMGESQNKWQRGLDAQVGGMRQNDLEGWRNRGLQAAGIQSQADQSARGNIAQGYSADQQKAASIYNSNMNETIARMQAQTAANALGQAGRFGTWDRNFQQSTFDAQFPYWSMGQAAQAMYPDLQGFGTTTGYNQSPYQDPWGSAASGGLGGGMMGYGMMYPNGRA